MATSQISRLETADHLQARIEAAEQRLQTSLGDLPADHPVALAATDLLEAQNEMRALVREEYEARSGKKPEFSSVPEAEAAIQIEREHHTPKAEFKDVLKALFMWRDDPATVAKDKG